MTPLLSGTNIRVLSGVPFSSDYKHTRWFANRESQTAYMESRTIVHSQSEFNVQRTDGKTYVSVPKGVEEIREVNYLMFQNASYSDKWFYAFIERIEYVNKKTTYLHFKIDVLQTWMFEFQFKPSFVVREHCPLWYSDGSPYINTVDEGLNYGTEYDVVSIDNFVPYGYNYFLVIVTKEQMHTDKLKIVPTMNGIPQPLSYYVHPFKYDGTHPIVKVGTETISTLSYVENVIKNLSMQENAVNNIVSMYITDMITGDITYDENTDTMTFDSGQFATCTIDDGVHPSVTSIYVRQLTNYHQIRKNYGNKYADFSLPVDESKLLMYPYTCTVLSDLKGNQTVLKNEYINSDDLEVFAMGSLGTSNKVAYGVVNYLQNIQEGEQDNTKLDHAVINNNPNDIPVVTDYLSAFLQGNRNQLENQKNTATFNGVMSGVGATLGLVTSIATLNGAGAVNSLTQGATGIGNSVLQIQGLQAKQQDIDNTPASLTKLGNNTNFDYGHGISGLFIIRKQIKDEYAKKIGSFFKMFGYKVNEVKLPNLHTRQNFNYVQTSNCFITGDINNEDKKTLMKIFDSGITLWHTNDIGNYSLENGVI